MQVLGQSAANHPTDIVAFRIRGHSLYQTCLSRFERTHLAQFFDLAETNSPPLEIRGNPTITRVHLSLHEAD